MCSSWSGYNETHLAQTIEGISADLQVFTLTGRGSISQPFVFVVELISDQPSLDLEVLMYKPAFLHRSPSGSGMHSSASHKP